MEQQQQGFQVEPGRVIDSMKVRIVGLIDELSMAEAAMNMFNDTAKALSLEVQRLTAILEKHGIDPSEEIADVVDLEAEREARADEEQPNDDEPSEA